MDNWYEDIQYKIKQFVQYHKDDNYEIGHSQTFLNNFFKIFDLVEAHQQLDKKVESLYRKEPFADDDDRLEFLLEEYSKMIGNQEKL